MKFEEKGKLLSAESRPYDFNGQTGVSHKVRVLIGDEIYSLRSNATQVSDIQDLVGEEGTAVIKVTSVKEKLGAELVSFKI